MSAQKGAALIGFAALAAILFSNRAAAVEPLYDADGTPDIPTSDLPPPTIADLNISGGDAQNLIVDDNGDLTPMIADPSNPDAALEAFRYMLRSCEHVYPRDVIGGACYGIFYGGSSFSNFDDHPVLTGEKKGIPLSHDVCVAAGYADGICVSTAAGAYQINVPTWREFRAAGSWGPRLDSFSPVDQDECARRIMLKIGALAKLGAGDLQGAIDLASARWASLPGARTKQNPKPIEFALARFNENGVA